MSDGPPCPRLPFPVSNGRYLAKEKLGSGCFATVCSGVDNRQRRGVAIKFEESTSKQPLLELEQRTLKRISADSQPQGFAEVFFYGREKGFNCLCMELLGPTLEDRLQSCKGKFSVSTTLVLAEQILQRLEFLHSRGLIHRDIKPENFTMGHGDKSHHVYLIDFGLAMSYFEGRHVREVQRNHLTGTVRYASINAHRGWEQSRRDDLEAVGHMLAYFLRGSLPWSGLKARSTKEKYKKIMEKKISVPVTELLSGYPQAFGLYLETCRSMNFSQRPDYEFLRGLIRDASASAGSPGALSLPWLEASPPASPVPLRWEPPRQPEDELNRTASTAEGLTKATSKLQESVKTRVLNCTSVLSMSRVRQCAMPARA